MSQGYAFSERFIERRLAQGWAAVERALGLLEALTSVGAPSPSHISRTLHRRACALLRPAEKMARRIITTLAAKLPAPKLPPTKPLPPAPDRNGPRMSRIEICGPLHAVLHPRPPKTRQPNRSTAASFRLIEPFGGPSMSAYNPPRRPFAKSAPAISDFNRDAPRPGRDSALLQTQSDICPLRQISSRITALQDALDHPERYAARMARWLARRNAGRVWRRTPFHRRMPGKIIVSRSRRDPPYETLDRALHHIALRAIDSS